ncbi:uncharacterized protein LOC120270346 [Dioscorea cayenensis subsp. rotundata]|uniref:Uncharacterized protein LOC120270346 n=1 Tax=Dioscorea cayennensis subsp. rotundata TaxID=55577 RepID=A0AB40C2P1_DIOCR|nr:uncharacterized protein LOC120270346 [Dioscorea cayenensis subsp. rotundata]
MDGTTVEIGSSSGARAKRGTPNKSWKTEYDDFLIPVLVEQVKKGMKCDKTFKKPAFVYAASAVNARFKTNYTAYNVENHYRTLKARFCEIKKAKGLSGAGWNDAEKIITLSAEVYKTYTEAHPAAIPFINKPLSNYDGLCIICGDDNATGSYATSMFANIEERLEEEDMELEGEPNEIPVNNEDNSDQNISPPVHSSSLPSTPIRTQRGTRRGNAQVNGASIADLILAVDRMGAAMENPALMTSMIYNKVFEVEGFEDNQLEEVFDYLDAHEGEGRRFVQKKLDMRKSLDREIP